MVPFPPALVIRGTKEEQTLVVDLEAHECDTVLDDDEDTDDTECDEYICDQLLFWDAEKFNTNYINTNSRIM